MEDRNYTANISPGDSVTVAGWVHEIRDLGGIAFLILRDQTGNIQIKFEKDELPEAIINTGLDLHRESAIKIEGMAFEEERAPTGIEIIPNKIDVLAEADPELPLDPTGKVDSELSTRLDNRTLDLRAEEKKIVFEVRAEIQRAAREFFRSIGCTEINTSKIVATGTEGGTELFPVSYFDQEAFLNQSPQLFKQLIAGSGLERVFEIGPIFRAEEHNTPRHLNESSQIDFEALFINHEEAMDFCEELLRAIYRSVKECFDSQTNSTIKNELCEGTFPRLTYSESIDRINSSNDFKGDLSWGDDLSTEAEKVLGREIESHYFITDWPSELKPFYIQDYDDSSDISKGFDLMHPRMELVSGGQREHRYNHLVEALEQQGLNPSEFKYYTEMFRYGVPPHAGWAYGVERLVMTILDLDNIREAVLFPRDRQRISP